MYLYKGAILTVGIFVFLHAQEVVIDINSLVEPDLDAKERALMQQLGFSARKWLARAEFLAHSLAHGIPLTQDTIQEEFFRHLQAAAPEAHGESVPYQNTVLPTLMCDWLAQQDDSCVVRTFETYLDKRAELSPERIRFYKAVAFATFNAQKYALTSTLNPDMLDFIHTCHQTKNPVYLVGNTNGNCFAALKERFDSEFAYFDASHCYFSYQDGLLKPEVAFYTALKEHVGIHSQDQVICLESPATRAHVPASMHHLGTRTLVPSQAILQELAEALAHQETT